MLRLMLVLGIILYIAVFYAILFKRTIGKTILFSYMSLILLMFLAALMGPLSYFKHLLGIFIILTLAYICVMAYKKGLDYKDILHNICRPSALFFLLFFIYMYFVLENKFLSNIDDIGFWGTKLLDMNRTGSLYTDEYMVFGATSYPPLPHLVCYAMISLFGNFDQSYSMLAMGTFTLSFFLPAIDRYGFNLKELLKSVIRFFLIILVTLMVQNNHSLYDRCYIYNSLYVDWLLGVALAYGFYSLYTIEDDVFSYLNVAISCVVLSMAKQIGIALMLLIWVTAFLVVFIKNKKLYFNKKEVLKYGLIVIGVPLFIYGIWKLKLNQYIQFSIDGGIGESISSGGLLESTGTIDTTKDFIKAYFTTGIFIKPVKLSYFAATFIVTIILIIFGYFKKVNRGNYSIPVMFFLGSVGYALGILLTYLFIITTEGLVMYGRYMQTYTYAGLVLIYMIILHQDYDFKIIAPVTLASLLIVNPKSVETILYNPNYENLKENIVPEIEYYFDNDYQGEKMLVINQTEMRYRSLIQYIAQENNKNIKYSNVNEETTVEQLKDILKGYELLFVGDTDDVFGALWSQLTKEHLFNDTVYQIVYEGDDVDLEVAYSWNYLDS